MDVIIKIKYKWNWAFNVKSNAGFVFDLIILDRVWFYWNFTGNTPKHELDFGKLTPDFTSLFDKVVVLLTFYNFAEENILFIS